MSENKSDIKTKPEIVTATVVVTESSIDTDLGSAAASSFEDPERGLAITASEKLKQTDKKTILFAGYVFWALIFVSGGTTAGVLLSRKNATIDPSPSPTKSPIPTATPSAAPSSTPTYAACDHSEIENKLFDVFGENNCKYVEATDDSEVSELLECEKSKTDLSNSELLFTVQYKSSFGTPETFKGISSRSEVVENTVDILFTKNNIACNFHLADTYFELITRCTDDEITKKLMLVFDKTECKRNPFGDGHLTECKSALDSNNESEVAANYTSFYDQNSGKYLPKSLTMTYSKDQKVVQTIEDLPLSDNICTFEEETSVIYETLAPICDRLHYDVIDAMDWGFGGSNYCFKSEKNGNPTYFCSRRNGSTSLSIFFTYEYHRSEGGFLLPVALSGAVTKVSTVWDGFFGVEVEVDNELDKTIDVSVHANSCGSGRGIVLDEVGTLLFELSQWM